MKTIKYIFTVVLIGAFYIFAGCSKEDSKGISKITTPAVITLKGSNPAFIGVGGAYVDSGAVVTGGTLVSTVNTVLPEVAGAYFVRYIAKNSDGAVTYTQRTVDVLKAGNDSIDLSGNYIGGRGTTVGGPVTITKVGTGVFYVSDLFGEFYEIFRGYGAAYRGPGILTYIGNNQAITPVNSTSGFGDFNIAGTASISKNAGKFVIQYQLELTDGSPFPSVFFLNQQ